MIVWAKSGVTTVGVILQARARGASSTLNDIQKHASEFSKTFTQKLNAVTSTKNKQAVNKALKEGSEAVLQQLSAFSSSLQGALPNATGKAKEALEQARTNVEKQMAELRKAHPDAEKQAGELKNKIQAAVTKAVQESQKVAKEAASSAEEAKKKLAPQLTRAYDDLVQKAEEVQKKLHDAASK